MAAREHQGLQIALIIFVILAISLTVTSYWFFDQFKNEQRKNQGHAQHAQKAEANQKQGVEDLDKIKRMIGFGTRDDVGLIEAAFKKDMELHGGAFPEASRNYPFLVKELDKQVKKKNEQLVDSNVRLTTLEDKIQQDDAEKETKLSSYRQELDRETQDSASQRSQFNEDRDTFKKAEIDLAKKFDDKRKEFQDMAGNCAKEMDQVTLLLIKVTEQVKILVAGGKERAIDDVQADGNVSWVNQRSRVVWLNRGSDDGLRRQVSFTVIGADENNPLKAEKKGSVEVTRLLDRHLSEARIIDDSPSNPIVPGDKIFSVAWQPGRAEHFALIGFMDLDKDGVSDCQRIRDIISLNGGIVDEVVDENSKAGEMTINTRYLVRGMPPTDKSSAEATRLYSEAVKEAETLPVKTISVPELVEYLGYKAKERTIPLGADSRSADFKPRAPEEVQRKSSNNMFQKRRESPTGGVKSAY